jgi:hypothetical protein
MSRQTFLASCKKKNETIEATSTNQIEINAFITLFKSVHTYIHAVEEENGIWERRAHSFVTARTLSTNRCNI